MLPVECSHQLKVVPFAGNMPDLFPKAMGEVTEWVDSTDSADCQTIGDMSVNVAGLMYNGLLQSFDIAVVPDSLVRK